MSKVRALLIIGVLLLVEGYFYFIRGILPVSMFSDHIDGEVVYMKVAVDDGFNTNILFYGLGIVFVVLAIILSNTFSNNLGTTLIKLGLISFAFSPILSMPSAK